MKNNKINTVILVLLNLSFIAGFSYVLFNGGLEKILNTDKNKFQPVAAYIISIDKSIPSSNQFPRQSMKRTKIRSFVDNNQGDNTIPAASNLESFYGSKSKSRKGTRGLSSSSAANELIDMDDRLSISNLSGEPTIYAGSRHGGIGDSEGATNSGIMPFTDGISTLPRASAPRGPGNSILIDPQTDPVERKRIPVGEGLGIMLLFAAAFSIIKNFRSRVL